MPVGAGGQRHQDRPAPRGFQFGAGAGPGPAHHQAGRFHGLIHAGDEGNQPVARVTRPVLQPLQFRRTRLVENLPFGHPVQQGRADLQHGLVDGASPAAAPQDQQPEGWPQDLGKPEITEEGLSYRGSHYSAIGTGQQGAHGFHAAPHAPRLRRHQLHERARGRIALMQEVGDLQVPGRHQGWRSTITAGADDGPGPVPAPEGFQEGNSAPEFPSRPCQVERRPANKALGIHQQMGPRARREAPGPRCPVARRRNRSGGPATSRGHLPPERWPGRNVPPCHPR